MQAQQTDDGALQEASAGNGLDENAVFTYEIYNDITDMSDSVRGSCPYELIGKEMTDVKEFYPDWQVTEFSSDAVTLRKNLGMDNTDRYVVGIYEGYVAVFYENSEEGIYMLTDTPVSVLEDDKRRCLRKAYTLRAETGSTVFWKITQADRQPAAGRLFSVSKKSFGTFSSLN